jgi:hypothetical protein
LANGQIEKTGEREGSVEAPTSSDNSGGEEKEDDHRLNRETMWQLGPVLVDPPWQISSRRSHGSFVFKLLRNK